MSYLEMLPKTTVKISNAQKFLGSGVLVSVDGKFYVITALHVVGNDKGRLITNSELSSVTFDSEAYGELDFLGIVGRSNVQQKYDIFVVEVDPGIIADFPDLRFCDDVNFPEAKFIFRGTANSETPRAQ